MLKNRIYTCRFSFRYRSKGGLNSDYIYRRSTNNIKAGPWKGRYTLLLVLLISFSKFIGERGGKLYDEETIVSVVRATRVNAFEISRGRLAYVHGTNVAWALCSRKQVVYAWAYSIPSKSVISASRRRRRPRRLGPDNDHSWETDATWFTTRREFQSTHTRRLHLACPCPRERSVLPCITSH